MDKSYADLDVRTESDVEQKLIVQLLLNPRPLGLGYSRSDFRTKLDIRKIKIDKGQTTKLYYPDYIVILLGLPVMVIEAKAPGEDLSEAFRECRLYATEINASFRSAMHPCAHIVASDGERTWAGTWDTDIPNLELRLDDFEPTNPRFHDLVALVSKERMLQIADGISRKAKGRARFLKPVFLLGGKTTRGGSVGENSFGSNLALEYKYMFNPNTEDERRIVVQNAYVRSMKRESHVQPIDRIIRRAASPSSREGRIIEDTARPIEVLQALEDPHRYAHELCLLIGSVGAGKSTFVDYLKEVGLPQDLRQSTAWITVNLNEAPISKELIYNWTMENILARVKSAHEQVDFDDLDFLQAVFSGQLSRWSKGPAALFSRESDRYKELLYQELTRLFAEKEEHLSAVIQRLYASKGIMPIVVLDNCDKRDRDSQLLMFEVANWLKTRFHCIVFLPLREVTFDQFRHEPPIDTVISDLVFRIDAPLLERVIYERFRLAQREIEANQKSFCYQLHNGMRVECKRKDVGSYLKAMLSSLFQNHFSKRLLVGLAGRNIRKGIEIFLDFCKSGYISEDDILRIRTTEGAFSVPPHVVTLIMLKGRRMFYEDSNSRIKNLFHCDKDDVPPNPFSRIAILRWLDDRTAAAGPTGVKGYHRAAELISDLKAVGYIEERLRQEIDELLAAECIVSESQRSRLNDPEELLSISPSGVVHLDLVRDISYLSIVSEDTLFRDEDVAKRIAANLTGRGPYSSTSRQTAIENAIAIVDYLDGYSKNHLPKPSNYLDDIPVCTYVDFSELHRFVHEVAMNDRGYIDYNELAKLYKPGMEIDAQVSSTQHYGIFVEFGLNGIGFVPIQQLAGSSVSDFERGETIRVRIVGFNDAHKKFDVEILPD